MKQCGFFIDLSRCIGCHACEIACKQWHNIDPGPIKPMRIYQWESNSFPETRLHILPVVCFHCKKPVCIKACPHQAVYKEKKYGAVLVDDSKCEGERKCFEACPYGAPQFAGDKSGQKMSKCTMCIDRLEQGLKPICVLSCSMRALEFGLMDELSEKYGNSAYIEGMPVNSITIPSVIYKPVLEKKQIIPWNSNKALELWRERQSPRGEVLPPIFNQISELTNIPKNILSRDKFVLKARNTREIMYYTTDDE